MTVLIRVIALYTCCSGKHFHIESDIEVSCFFVLSYIFRKTRFSPTCDYVEIELHQGTMYLC